MGCRSSLPRTYSWSVAEAASNSVGDLAPRSTNKDANEGMQTRVSEWEGRGMRWSAN